MAALSDGPPSQASNVYHPTVATFHAEWMAPWM